MPALTARAPRPQRPDGRTLRAKPRVTARPRAGGHKHQAILEAAALLMMERGFVGTTIEDVASELALTKAAFYYYVENKEELLFQISSQTLDVAAERVTAIARSREAPGAKLNAVIDTFVRLVAERPQFFTVYFQEKGHLQPAHRKIVIKTERRIVSAIEGIVRDGVAARTFRAVDPTATAFAILGSCFWVYKWYRPAGRLSVDEVSRSFQALAAAGYLAGDRARRGTGQRAVH